MLTYPDEFTVKIRRDGNKWAASGLDFGATGYSVPDVLRQVAECLEATERIEGNRRLREADETLPN